MVFVDSLVSRAPPLLRPCGAWERPVSCPTGSNFGTVALLSARQRLFRHAALTNLRCTRAVGFTSTPTTSASRRHAEGPEVARAPPAVRVVQCGAGRGLDVERASLLPPFHVEHIRDEGTRRETPSRGSGPPTRVEHGRGPRPIRTSAGRLRICRATVRRKLPHEETRRGGQAHPTCCSCPQAEDEGPPIEVDPEVSVAPT